MKASKCSVSVLVSPAVRIRIISFICIISLLVVFSASLSPGLTYAEDDGTSATLDTSNLSHAYDNDNETSANIFTADGHIVYRLDTLGTFPGIPTSIVMNASDNGQYTVTVEGLDIDGIPVPGGAITVDIIGHKGSYIFTVPGGSSYLRIRGITGAALYIFEISAYDPNAEDGRARNANNLSHAFDGNDATSANIFDENGYIIFFLNRPQLHNGMDVSIIMNGADGNFNNVEMTAYSFDYVFDPGLATMETQTINIDGLKNSYTYTVPVWAAWLKIEGIPNTSLYIYEIAEKLPEPISDRSFHANNIEHAFDADYSTSANILSQDGYLQLLLNRMQFHPGMKSRFTMNTPDGAPADVTLTAYSFDFFFEEIPSMQETVTLPISGIKNAYTYDIPAWAAVVEISVTPESALYIYEVEEYDPFLHFPYAVHANNLSHAYDGNELTSANIFEETGYAVFDLTEADISQDSFVRFMMNGADGLPHDVTVEAMDWTFALIPGSTDILSVNGYRPITEYEVPAGARYLKVNGIPDTDLYIYEIFPKVDPFISSYSTTDNMNGTMTLSLSAKDRLGNGITGLTTSDIEIYISGLNTWDTLASLDAGSYWEVDLQDLGGGEIGRAHV